mmetsp:Transcript_38371/g.68560  ORF Transcript_38371/g.68560 Transcript_38371/m.68560 type:complete len:272 (-) Transcript_38371:1610-2425(-)
MVQSPVVGGRIPVIMLMVVVLPAPLCPSTTLIWPSYIDSSSPSTATLPPPRNPPRKTFRSRSIFTASLAPGATVSRSPESTLCVLGGAGRGRHIASRHDLGRKNSQGRRTPNAEGSVWSKYQASSRYRRVSRRSIAMEWEMVNSPAGCWMSAHPIPFLARSPSATMSMPQEYATGDSSETMILMASGRSGKVNVGRVNPNRSSGPMMAATRALLKRVEQRKEKETVLRAKRVTITNSRRKLTCFRNVSFCSMVMRVAVRMAVLTHVISHER